MGYAVVALIALAAGVIALRGGVGAAFSRGVARTVAFADGQSTSERFSRLRSLFASVVDKGGGVYVVTADFDGPANLPPGASVSGEADIVGAAIELWAGYYKGRHVGFAYNKSSADLIHRAYFPITFVRSSQAFPSSWAAQWKPVYGDGLRRTVWGRFRDGLDGVVADYLRGEGVYAMNDPNPNLKSPDEWRRLALQ